MLNESEKKGTSGLKSHSSLAKGDMIKIQVSNEASSGQDIPKKTEIKINTNKTVYDLKVQIAKSIKASVFGIRLQRVTGDVKDTDNGRTINELRFRNDELIVANSKPVPPIEQVSLIGPDGEIVAEARKIFASWFEIFSEGGKMNSEGCANFIHSCTNDNCKGDDKRVKDVF